MRTLSTTTLLAALPHDVDDSETLVRVIKSPYHLTGSKKALRKQAFHPRPGAREISVIRLRMGSDFCKDKAVALLEGGGATYEGLASGLVEAVRQIGSVVEDSPEDFVGHAHIVSAESHVKNDTDNPPEPELMQRLDHYYKSMVEHFAYHADPEPEGAGWSGPALER